MATNIKILGVGMLVCWACLGCMTSTAVEPDESTFMVSPSQQDQLNGVFDEIRQQASRLPRKSLSRTEILALMATFEADIAQILNPLQMADYQTLHRPRFADQVYRDTMRRYRPGGSGRTGATGYHQPSMVNF